MAIACIERSTSVCIEVQTAAYPADDGVLVTVAAAERDVHANFVASKRMCGEIRLLHVDL
ncbi:hypothetical protein [Bradyrhizobium macuxiense]|nr:hypothetical protein [Bradyrhizobium macuxiense]